MNSRQQVIHNLRDVKNVEFENAKPTERLEDTFAADVFGERQLERMLPASSYKSFKETIRMGKTLDPNIADQVANAMKEWALARGATHFSHWFQPMTGLTAEKHDSFLQTTMADSNLIMSFSGKELIKGEPDASSFPSGGIRSTFEARGYTAWDMSSPAFIRKTQSGSTLYIPTCFCSWTGEALDKKTGLLRSQESLSREGVRLLKLLGDNSDYITPTLGVEQEFFLIDRGFFLLRPDLVQTGRTLIGAKPPKGQELEDHYFGAMNSRILACIQEVERELWRLGVPTKTRHNEVAPGQYEMAPIFENASLASDHNMLAMQILREVSTRHGFQVLLHEKPFAGVNGSGKHCNWSMSTENGENLLDPGKTPIKNARFMIFLTAVIRAVDVHADLLRVSIVTPGNDYRLGANEAPPAIMSIYLGRELDGVCRAIMLTDDQPSSPAPMSPTKGGSMMLGVSSLPAFPRDSTDRNRTSPFAFTGNKFEFRAVGSSQTVSRPTMILNTIVAESLNFMADEIEVRMHRDHVPLNQAIQDVVRETLRKHYRVVFNGNNYSEEWVAEAARRGLPNLKTTPEALAEFSTEKNLALFENAKVLSRGELVAHRNIMYENYIKALSIEATSLFSVASSYILPCAIRCQGELARSVKETQEILGDVIAPQKKLLWNVSQKVNDLMLHLEELKKVIDEGHSHSDSTEQEQLHHHIVHYNQVVVKEMERVRAACDSLEVMLDDKQWPLPKYSEMLFIR